MKKIVVLLLVIVTVVLSVPVSAASSSLSDIIHDEIIQLIDVGDYGEDPDDEEIYLISVMESGYTEKGFTDQTALYVYLYNPSRKDLSDSVLNTIQIATKYNSDGQPTDFKKYPLLIEGTTSGGLYARAKVNIKAKDLAYVRDGARWYGITEFEIYDGRVYNAKTHPCGYVYKFSGSGKTLSCELESFLTVELDVGFTSYLTSNSSKGYGYFNQIVSVYFSIPEWIEQEYQKLYGVSYEYYKYRTSPIVLYESDELHSLKLQTPYTFNQKASLFGEIKNTYSTSLVKLDFPLLLSFKVDDMDSNARHVSSADLESAFLNHFTSNPSSIEDKVLGLYHKELFTDDYSENNHKVTEYKTRSEMFSMDSYGETHGFWEKLFAFGVLFGKYDLDEKIENAKYIQPINTASFDVQDFSSAFLVDDSDIPALQTFVRSAEDNRENAYLLRFAHTDNYYASTKFSAGGYDYRLAHSDNSLNTFPIALVQEDVYLGFDIIKLDFSDDGKDVTTFGVVSSPMNIFPSVDDVFTGTGDDVVDKGVDLSWLYKLAAVLLIGALGFSVIWVIGLFGQLGEASTNRQILRELRRRNRK